VIGAYGEDALDRATLVAAARERLASRRGVHVAPADAVLDNLADTNTVVTTILSLGT
jgi:hypothetical protein